MSDLYKIYASQDYVDQKIEDISFTSDDIGADAKGSAAQALSDAKAYTNETVTTELAKKQNVLIPPEQMGSDTLSITGTETNLYVASSSDNAIKYRLVSSAVPTIYDLKNNGVIKYFVNQVSDHVVGTAISRKNALMLSVAAKQGDTQLSITGGTNNTLKQGDILRINNVTYIVAEDVQFVNSDAIVPIVGAAKRNHSIGTSVYYKIFETSTGLFSSSYSNSSEQDGIIVCMNPDARCVIVSKPGTYTVRNLGIDYTISFTRTGTYFLFNDAEFTKELTISNYLGFGTVGKINYKYIATDNTLSVEGLPADAKAVSDALTDVLDDAKKYINSRPYVLEGRKSDTTVGEHSNALGRNTTASNSCSYSEGCETTASGHSAHAEGQYTIASGYASHAEGIQTVASGQYSHVQGRRNIEDTDNKYAHIVGNGSLSAIRSNAHTLDWEGNAWFQGEIKIGGTGQDDANAKIIATQEYVNASVEDAQEDTLQFVNKNMVQFTNKTVNMPRDAWWESVVYGNDKFVAVGTEPYTYRKVAYSKDGIIWTEAHVPSSYEEQLISVAYGNGKFVAVGRRYDQNTIISPTDKAFYSEDGETWAQTTMPVSYSWESVAYGNGKFVAVTSNSNIAVYSDDGITWLDTTIPSASCDSIAYGNNRFVALASGSNIAAYSDDGITWIEASTPAGNTWHSITYVDDKFVAIANDYDTIIYSKDGMVWTQVTLPNRNKMWLSIAYGNNKFVMVSYNSSVALYSEDCNIWNETILPVGGSWKSVAYGSDRFIAIDYHHGKVVYSEDGITWKNQFTGFMQDEYDITKDVENVFVNKANTQHNHSFNNLYDKPFGESPSIELSWDGTIDNFYSSGLYYLVNNIKLSSNNFLNGCNISVTATSDTNLGTAISTNTSLMLGIKASQGETKLTIYNSSTDCTLLRGDVLVVNSVPYIVAEDVQLIGNSSSTEVYIIGEISRDHSIGASVYYKGSKTEPWLSEGITNFDLTYDDVASQEGIIILGDSQTAYCVCILKEDTYSIPFKGENFDIEFTQKGVYFLRTSTVHVNELVVDEYIKQLDEKYIPKEVVGATYYANFNDIEDVYLYSDLGCTKKVTKAEFSSMLGGNINMVGVMNGVAVAYASPLTCAAPSDYGIIVVVTNVIDGVAEYGSWYTAEYEG